MPVRQRRRHAVVTRYGTYVVKQGSRRELRQMGGEDKPLSLLLQECPVLQRPWSAMQTMSAAMRANSRYAFDVYAGVSERSAQERTRRDSGGT